MINIQGPAGDLCAGTPHALIALGAGVCITAQWVVISVPVTASPDDVVFGSPNGRATTVTVPVPGAYAFAFDCCEAV